MVDFDRTEEEQLAALKQWWRSNGTALIVGITLAIAAIFGYKAWQNNQLESRAQSSLLYQQLVEASNAEQQAAFLKAQQAAGSDSDSQQKADKPAADTTRFLAKELQSKTDISGYEMLADLYLAQSEFSAGELDAAHKQLENALETANSESLKRLLQARLARVESAQKQYDSALSRLDVPESDVFYPYFQELKGDIHVMQDDAKAAASAYEKARIALVNQRPEARAPIVPSQNDGQPESPELQQTAQALSLLDTKIADLGVASE